MVTRRPRIVPCQLWCEYRSRTWWYVIRTAGIVLLLVGCLGCCLGVSYSLSVELLSLESWLRAGSSDLMKYAAGLAKFIRTNLGDLGGYLLVILSLGVGFFTSAWSFRQGARLEVLRRRRDEIYAPLYECSRRQVERIRDESRVIPETNFYGWRDIVKDRRYTDVPSWLREHCDELMSVMSSTQAQHREAEMRAEDVAAEEFGRAFVDYPLARVQPETGNIRYLYLSAALECLRGQAPLPIGSDEWLTDLGLKDAPKSAVEEFLSAFLSRVEKEATLTQIESEYQQIFTAQLELWNTMVVIMDVIARRGTRQRDL